MKTKNIKSIIRVFPIILFLLSQNLSNCQVEYDHEINLPEGQFESNAPRDIIYADDKMYVYNYKGIMIYSAEEGNIKTHLGTIDLSSQFGRFAPMYFSGHLHAPDVKLMAHDPDNHILYFVTPFLTISSVSTATLDTIPYSEGININEGFDNKNLNSFCKLEYDDANDRLFVLARSLDNNLHSFDSFFGIYKKTSSDWTPIFEEFLDGSDSVDYLRLIGTFAFNTHNNNFYLSRKHLIEIWEINDNEQPSLINPITTPNQERNGKLLLVESKNLLLVFPYLLDYSAPVNQYIYQINTENTFEYDSVIAPHKRILDAVYLSDVDNQDIIMCYSNDGHKQIDLENNPDQDMAVYYYDTETNIFNFLHTIYTQSPDEIDTDPETNLNRPFKLTTKNDESVIVSKKNEIMEVSLSTNTYDVSPIYYARDNYFNKGAVDDSGNTFIINAAKSGLEIISGNLVRDTVPIVTAYPVYNTEYNPANRKLYFFNRLSTANTGFYVYDLNNETQTFVETTKAIGDLVYNAEQNHILVSEYCPDTEQSASVKVFDANDLSYVQTLTWANNNYDFPGKIFVAPNGKIYISMNMRADDNLPIIQIIGAGDYSNIDNKSAGLTGYPDENCSTFQSFYCYNPYDDKVYATFGPFLSIDPPYQTSSNSSQLPLIEPIEFSITNAGGKLISFDSHNEPEYYSIERPSEIICSTPDSQIGNPDYKGTLFINAHYDLLIFNCDDNSIEVSDPRISYIYDMVYCPESSSLYAYDHEHISVYGLPDVDIIHVHKVQEDGSSVEIWTEPGYASSISYNKFDQQLYVYYLSNQNLIGQVKTKVITIDPFADQNAETGFIELPFKNMFPEIVPQANHPHFDAYNKAYYPNGAHSSVSVVKYTAKEALKLHFTGDKLLEWLSIPRMLNNETTNWQESDSVVDVFNRERFGDPYSYFFLAHLEAESGEEITNEWEFENWNHVPDINTETFSYRGYTMKLNDSSDNYIYMYGNIKEPTTSFPLFPEQDNWAGYFLTQEQDIFDALGAETLDLIDYIDHQDYCCEKKIAPDPYDGPTHGGTIQFETYFWVCDKHQTNISYGEMVKLHSSETVELSIQWQNSGNTTREKLRPDVEYYSYSETSSYTAITIVLNYESNPLEIGAFVNEQCVGAVALMPEDSVVILRAYLDGVSPDSIVFQDWFGTKSSENGIIKDYRVFNKSTGFYENRALKSNNNLHRVRISFKKGDSEEGVDIVENSINIWPNPASDKLNYSFYSDVDGKLNISLFDINGKLVSVLIDKAYQKGLVSGTVGMKGYAGYSVKPGIYFVKIKMGNSVITKKLIIQ